LLGRGRLGQGRAIIISDDTPVEDNAASATIRIVKRICARTAAGLLVVIVSACTSSPAPSATASASPAASPQPSPKLTTYTPADFATALAWAPDGRLFYAERSGTIRTFDGKNRGVFATV
jgi:hypothetical protein